MARAPKISELTTLGLTPESSPPLGFDPREVTPCHQDDKVHPLLSVAIDVSGKCNLACRYCAEAASQPRRDFMTVEVLEAAVGLLDTKAPPSANLSIRIGSGEALLAVPRLHHLHALLQDAVAPIDVFITTNGTLIDDTIADWLTSTGWRIKISLDGPKSIHDAWRRDRTGGPTYERVARAVKSLVKQCPERISVAAVLCRGANPADVFDSIASLGVRRIELLPVAIQPSRTGEDIRPTIKDLAAYVEFIRVFARAVAADGADAHPTLVRFEDCVRNVMGYGNAEVPCGAGRNYLCVGPNGALYPCFRFVGITKYCIGHIDTGIDQEAAMAFRMSAGRAYHLRSRCNQCWAAPLCGGPCFSIAEFFSTGGGAPDALHCAYKLADARAAFWLVSHLREHNMEELLPFLSTTSDLS